MPTPQALAAQARAAEQRGDSEEAVRLFVQAGDLEEAARVLVARSDFSRAGRLLFRAVGLPVERLPEASAEQRKLAVKAAICLAKAGETGHAVALFVGAGDGQRAIDTLTRAGDLVGAAKLRAQLGGPTTETRVGGVTGQVGATKYAEGRRLEERGDREGALAQYIQGRAFQDAGRIARALGKTQQAGELFEEGGYFYEAAVCFHDVRDLRRCLDALVRVAKDHPRYRASCLKAIEIGGQFGELSFELDQFVSRFVSSGPEDGQEIDAFFVLGRLYEKLGFPDNASECYRKIAEKQPGHVAVKRLNELASAARGSNMVYERILREDGAFHGDAPRGRMQADPVSTTYTVPAELPELPELPDPRRPRQPTPQTAQKARPASTLLATPGAMPGAFTSRAPQQTPAGQSFGAPPAEARERQPSEPRVMEPARSARGNHAPTLVEQAEPARPEPAKAEPAKAEPAALELREGMVIAERYKLERQLGQGGTAIVFRAIDLELEEEVAIKIFTMPVEDADLVRRFKQELSVARKLSHPNIVRLHDIGAHRGCRFLTMEVLQGEDLASVIAKGPVPMDAALDYLVQAASGLGLAHSHGVVHRDIKPENFFVTTQGVLKVMDFGIAKKASAQKRTQAGFIAGTPPYMSPEQINGFADVTAAADMYSLGIVAYELFAGVLPFVHEELMPLLVMHMTAAPAPPVQHNPRLPAPLNDLILRLLEKEPERRVQSMAELGAQLAQLRPLVARAMRAG
jgi:tetratricopeptide (TPR) repeat protein